MGLDQIHAIKADVFTWITSAGGSWDLIFMDPPYAIAGQQALVLSILQGTLLDAGGILILEHASNNDYSGTPGFSEKRVYGQSTFSFFTQNTTE